MSLRLADDIHGVVAGVNGGTLTFDQAIAAIEALFAKFPSAVHRLAEGVKAGTVLPTDPT